MSQCRTLGRLSAAGGRVISVIRRATFRQSQPGLLATSEQRPDLEHEQPRHERHDHGHAGTLDVHLARRGCPQPYRLWFAEAKGHEKNCQASSLRPTRRPSHPVIPFACVPSEHGTAGGLIGHVEWRCHWPVCPLVAVPAIRWASQRIEPLATIIDRCSNPFGGKQLTLASVVSYVCTPTFHRLSTDLPQSFRRASSDLPQVVRRQACRVLIY